MTIPAELWPRISQLLDEALMFDLVARSPWLARLDLEHPDEALHVRRLLAAHDRADGDGALGPPPAELLAAALADEGTARGLAPGLLVDALDLDRVPHALELVLDHAQDR